MKVIALSALFCILLTFTAVADQFGNKASSFRLIDAQGTLVALEDFAGKVILLHFWATWCRPCRDELPELDRLYSMHRDQGLVVVGIAVDASAERVSTFLKKCPVGFPVVIDTKGDVAESYRFSGLPATFLIGRDGVIKRRYQGSGRDMISQYEKDIKDLLKWN